MSEGWEILMTWSVLLDVLGDGIVKATLSEIFVVVLLQCMYLQMMFTGK